MFASSAGSAAPASAPPSAHCHVTDGAWTVCPDGSHEWSDVTPQVFSDTHSYLYADQADLDPALHSPASPTDTFMLMYDECGRRTQLGPDEYLLVNFDTVEEEDGHAELIRYSVHIFTDGTLIFFENGTPVPDDAGHLRVRNIEGQKAAAGFGPSPRCAFDHVFAEYEIKLTATGLSLNGGYSPDPIFWGADPPNRPPVAADDTQKLEDSSVTVNVVANDTDPDGTVDPSSVSLASQPDKGTAVVNGDGTVTYTKGDSFEDTDTFTYTVADDQGARSNAATVEITSCPVGNSYPVTLPFVRVPINLLKPWIVEYDPVPLTFTAQAPPSPAYCSARSNVGTLRVYLRCNPLAPVGGCPLPAVLIRVLAANSVATANLDFYKAQDAPVVPICDWIAVSDNCLLNAGGGGTYVKWTTPGFQITDAFTGTVSYNTGPRTYWASLSALAPASASFGAKIQAAETFFHVTLISRLSSVDRLAIVQDPPADVLVTDPSGRQTGLTASGTVVNEIPGSQYFRSDDASAAVILEPPDGFYEARVLGTTGEPFSLSMGVVDIAGPNPSSAEPFISERRITGTVPAGPFSFEVRARSNLPQNVISNGLILLGVNSQGHLNVPGGPPSNGTGTTAVGLRYVPTGNEATSPGCQCEGWGVGDARSGVHGEADVDVGGVNNLTVESTYYASNQAISTVRVGNTFRVTHDYHPSASPDLIEGTVTIENISAAPADVRYRRVMDWDIEPTAFDEFVTLVTIQGAERAKNVLFSSDDGFASPNPLAGPSHIDFVGDAVDSGPDDHGALFDFGFGEVPPGGSVTFNIYYGAAGTEADANAALQDVRAEVYSYGQPNTPDGPTLGTPNTFIFAFSKVGGAPAVPPDDDGDGVLDEVDNCPHDANPGQQDANLNGLGDACERPGQHHASAAFLQAGLDGRTSGEAMPTAIAAEPSLADRLVRIVSFRLQAGLATNAAALTHDLVESLVEAGLVAPADAAALEHEVLARLGGDTTPPVVTCSASPPSLWPPNHKLVNVTATVRVTDSGSGPAGFTLAGATSSEPDNGTGDGDTTGDIAGWTIGTADVLGQFRAERSGSGPGRTYTLTYTGRDAAGNTASCTARVTVPHDRGG